MAQAVGVTRRPAADRIDRVTLVRVATIVVLLVLWEALARSGLLYKDVVPTVGAIAGGIWGIVSDPRFYANLQVTLFEIVASVLLGTLLGVVCGIAIGGSEFVGRVFEPLVHYLAPTPKIIFFPLLIMWFGIGEGSKIGMGTISSFFPVVLSVASGMRHIDPVLVRVGRSFRANPLQMATKIYLPAMRDPMINGIRLAFGVSVIGVLLAETKFARDGLGFMITRFYQQFDMPAMYGLVIIIFAFAIAVNSALGQLSRSPAP
mgnify:CR=1 FL=1